MRTSSFCIVVTLLCTAGCASTHVVDSDHSEQWILRAQDQLLGEDVIVRTTNGSGYSGKLTLLSRDSVMLKDDQGRSLVAEELSNVAFVGEPTNAAAPILGGIGGGLLGILIGGGLSAEDSDATLGIGVESAATGAIIGGIAGGVLGAIIGGLASKVDQYEIHQGGKRAPVKVEPAAESK